jgi:mannopine transport system permease protein
MENAALNRGPAINFGKIILAFFAGLIFVYLVVPTLMTIPMSISDTKFLVFPPRGFTLNWYHAFLTSEDWTTPALFSIRLAVLSTLFSLIIGFMVSLALVRGVLPGKKVLEVFFISPMMVPVIITSVAVYGLYAKFRLIGTITGMVIGHTTLCVPFVILVITANLYRFDISLEMAARNLGASAMKTFMHITIPLIKPGIIAAGIFCFISSFDELVLSMFLIGTKRSTLPIKLFSQIQLRLDPVVAAASTVFVVVSIGVIMSLALLRRDKKVKVKEKADERYNE